MPDVTVGGVRFNTVRLTRSDVTDEPASPDEAARPPVVFLHGLIMDNLSSWYYTVAPAVATTTEVVCYDLRGHGRSERPPSGYRLEDAVDDLFGVVDALGIEGPVHLVGNSFGGTIAIAAALWQPERVAGLGLIEAHPAFRFVAAMNPFDAVGTARISGAIYDRVCRVSMDYQSSEDEVDIAVRQTSSTTPALAGRVDREAPLGEDRREARAQRVELELVEQDGDARRRPLVVEALDVGEQLIGDRFAAELPDHRAQLELMVKRQPVVDGPDLLLPGLPEQVADLSIRIVGHEVEKSDRPQHRIGGDDQRARIPLPVLVEEPLRRPRPVGAGGNDGFRNRIQAEDGGEPVAGDFAPRQRSRRAVIHLPRRAKRVESRTKSRT